MRSAGHSGSCHRICNGWPCVFHAAAAAAGMAQLAQRLWLVLLLLLRLLLRFRHLCQAPGLTTWGRTACASACMCCWCCPTPTAAAAQHGTATWTHTACTRQGPAAANPPGPPPCAHSPLGVGQHADLHACGHKDEVVHVRHGGKPALSTPPQRNAVVAAHLLFGWEQEERRVRKGREG